MDISDPELRSLLNIAFRVARREGLNVADSEDVSSVAVMHLLESAEEVQHPVAWIVLVARRRAWAMRRRHGVRERFEEQQSVLSDESRLLSDSLEGALDLKAALLALSGTEKNAFLWRYVEGQSLGAIAATTGLSVETVKRRLKRGRESLHRSLSGRSVRNMQCFTQGRGDLALSMM
jgi:RNA polymerase sigma factor (sigma-70 family)